MTDPKPPLPYRRIRGVLYKENDITHKLRQLFKVLSPPGNMICSLWRVKRRRKVVHLWRGRLRAIILIVIQCDWCLGAPVDHREAFGLGIDRRRSVKRLTPELCKDRQARHWFFPRRRLKHLLDHSTSKVRDVSCVGQCILMIIVHVYDVESHDHLRKYHTCVVYVSSLSVCPDSVVVSNFVAQPGRYVGKAGGGDLKQQLPSIWEHRYIKIC